MSKCPADQHTFKAASGVAAEALPGWTMAAMLWCA